ncbi:MAG: beta-lactamase family protein [Lentisphaerales bacterium]|nr:beta-lactamase family protein [Lentisphaerales bacterium]
MLPKITLFLSIFLCGLTHSKEICRFSTKDRKIFDSEITKFMQKYNIPGLSIAMSNKGKIILAKGYGYANIEKQIKVTPEHKFRIASLSKPITSFAIMKLTEEKKFSLEDKVFGPNGLLSYSIKNPHTLKLTVKNLLEHTAGSEWSNEKNDPMYWQHKLGKDAFIEWALKKFQLSKTPGKYYHYSNFGYCLLGKIIEVKTGLKYSEYVLKLLKEKKITDLKIGTREKADGTKESVYYSQDKKFDAYSWPLKRMDSHGGWISTPISLIQFMFCVDGFKYPRDLLSSKSVKVMSTPSKANSRYALGWNVNSSNHWSHVGSLAGSGSIMVRTNHKTSWVILANSKSDHPNFFPDLDKLPWDILSN